MDVAYHLGELTSGNRLLLNNGDFWTMGPASLFFFSIVDNWPSCRM